MILQCYNSKLLQQWWFSNTNNSELLQQWWFSNTTIQSCCSNDDSPTQNFIAVAAMMILQHSNSELFAAIMFLQHKNSELFQQWWFSNTTIQSCCSKDDSPTQKFRAVSAIMILQHKNSELFQQWWFFNTTIQSCFSYIKIVYYNSFRDAMTMCPWPVCPRILLIIFSRAISAIMAFRADFKHWYSA